MGFKEWFGSGKKESPTRSLIALRDLGRPVSTPRDYDGFSKEAYQKNIIAFRAISGIAGACKGIPWNLYSKKRGMENKEITEHELLTLLKRPNPAQGQAAFIESVVAFLNIAGNSYIEAIGPNKDSTGKPKELWNVRPDRMKVVPGSYGLPKAYEYEVNGSKYTHMVDLIRGKSPVLHLKTFNPIDDWYGMSPIEAASYSIDQHNESGKWNLALLQNSAAPSGALVVKASDSNPGGSLDDEQYEKLKDQIDEKYSGAKNAGRPLLLEGGLDWKAMGLSPKDMEWMQGKNVSSREIALAFGYPPILLGIQGDSTYNNQKEAKLALYEETVLPLMDFIRDEFNNWLTPAFGDNLYLDYDKDSISALSVKREAVWSKVQTSDFLTFNEKRQAVGYEPIDGGDQLFVNAGLIPLDFASIDSINDPASSNERAPEKPASGQPSPNDENAEKRKKVALNGAQITSLTSVISDVANGLIPRSTGISIMKIGFNLSEQEAEEIMGDVGQGFTPDNSDAKSIDEKKKLKIVQTKQAEEKFTDFIKRWIKANVGAKVTAIQGFTRRKVIRELRKAVEENIEDGESVQNLSKVIGEKLNKVTKQFSKTRARLIARTETTIASNEGSRAAAQSLNLPGLKKEWISASDPRTRDSDDSANHRTMNGKRVNMDEKFLVPSVDGMDEMDGPGDPNAPVDQLANCRCVLTYTEDDKSIKSFGLRSAVEKRKYLLKVIRQRAKHEKALAARFAGHFESEGKKLIEGLQGINDASEAETKAMQILDETESGIEEILEQNLGSIMEEFGFDILKEIN